MKNTWVKYHLGAQVPAKVWAESMRQEQVMSGPLVSGVNQHIKMVSPVGNLSCSADHLPTDILIAHFTLLPKGVFNIVLTTIMPISCLKHNEKEEVTRECFVHSFHHPS